ncbi:hypothetical protein, partial [Pararhodobacter sp. SW119]|uniref:hypothetical protein n=1 Tax=Pararhodobacter sp. SW119 TaxID=2780075 RepID=UPI001AE0897B
MEAPIIKPGGAINETEAQAYIILALRGVSHFQGIGQDYIAEMFVWLAAFASLTVAVAGTMFLRLADPSQVAVRL